MGALNPLVVIVGETGSGKSEAAMKVARALDGEIINADSWAVYRGFDIGTAKPSAQDQNRVRHHLLDVADPLEGFNAALYKELANEAIKDTRSRGKLPILAGGTGLYIDSVIYDYQFLPVAPAEERSKRNQTDLEVLLDEAEKAGIDLNGIDVRNKRRVIRALEAGGRRPKQSEMRPGTLILGIAADRENLKNRIAERVDGMLEKGLEREVRRLAKKYGWNIEPMKGIGYAEWHEYFEGSQSLDQTRQRIISATMNLAKRQRTWFRSPRYNNLPTSGSPFLAKPTSDSLDIPAGMPQSPEIALTQKPSTLKQTSYYRAETERNNSIHWVHERSKIVDIATTKLNTLNS